MEFKISVALCTYNGANFIEDQLESILDQTLLPFEIVVSDDGSTDDTLAVIDSVWQGHSRNQDLPTLRVLRNERPLGVTRNFEQAVSECTGSLIALSDQDDVWAPDRLESVSSSLASDPKLLLVFSDARLVDTHGEPLGGSLFEALEITPSELAALRGEGAFETLLRRNLVTGATVVFRRELLEAALPFPAEWIHDEWLAIVAAAVGKLTWLPEQFVDYRQHGTNQIGVELPTLAYKVKRVLEPMGRRNEILAGRASDLLARLEYLGANPIVLELAQGKLEHEVFRAGLPASRLRRLVPVLAEGLTGRYRQFSSRQSLDILRDLLQPSA